MNVYVDSSVVLRVAAGSAGRLREWNSIAHAVSSRLIRLECARTLDRARIRFDLDDAEVASRGRLVDRLLAAFEIVPLDELVLARASEPFPKAIGSLDAIPLASPLLVRQKYADLVVATHDVELAAAARVMGFPVVGVDGT